MFNILSQSALLLTHTTSGHVVSDNDIDISFDGVDLIEGLRQLGELFRTLDQKFPNFGKIGHILGTVLGFFPPKFWFCLIIALICLVTARIIKRT